jgi:hypothetical protein
LQGGIFKNRKLGTRLGPQGAMNLHAAMQQYVRLCCTKAGVPVITLLDDSGYEALYRSYTKDRTGKRKTLVPVSFTRDHFMLLAVALYSSNKRSASRTRFMLLLATSAVARGDEIRDVRLANMAIEHMDIIGEHPCLNTAAPNLQAMFRDPQQITRCLAILSHLDVCCASFCRANGLLRCALCSGRQQDSTLPCARAKGVHTGQVRSPRAITARCLHGPWFVSG